ncbi:hypothetical protein, partial [Oenococcus oeni]|uniref:hypothetical protein n=1 Tax=Oenococcus oeni TaxID=1247 RepID=UPI000A7CB933
IITIGAMVIHMFMGSVIAVMGVTIPAFLAATTHMGVNPLGFRYWYDSLFWIRQKAFQVKFF